MTKQEFLAMSLPHDVKAIDTFECIWTIHAYKDALNGLDDNEHLSYENFIKEEGHKLILHPLSDLTKEIEHKGEKFVPIIELAKVAFTNSRYSFKLSEGLDKFVWIDDDWNNFKFYFEGYNFHYNGYNRFIPNQFKLYQKLIEWHFDLADLISKGDAIDVNTLETNPYK